MRARLATYAKDWDEIHVIVATGRDAEEAFIEPNIWVYPTRSRYKALYPLDMTKLGRFIIERRGITEITCQDPFLTGMAGVSLARRFHLPLELQVHTDIGSPNFPYTLANKFRKALALSYLKKADKIRVVSLRVQKYLTDMLGIAAEKISIRPIAVDTDRVKNAPVTVDLHTKYPQFEKIVLVASRLEPEKNIALAINAWAEVVKGAPRAGLVIVGRGSCEQSLKSLVARLGLTNAIIFESWADQATLFSYYKTADAFLSTSLFEGYGMTLVEAQAAGCLIVSTDAGIAREVGAEIIGWDAADAARGIKKAFGVY